jgi:hypothetical protein
LHDKLGGVAGDASARVVEALGERFKPKEEAIADAINGDADAAAKVRAIEDERCPEWIAYLSMAGAERDRMLKREDERESLFS